MLETCRLLGGEQHIESELTPIVFNPLDTSLISKWTDLMIHSPSPMIALPTSRASRGATFNPDSSMDSHMVHNSRGPDVQQGLSTGWAGICLSQPSTYICGLWLNGPKPSQSLHYQCQSPALTGQVGPRA